MNKILPAIFLQTKSSLFTIFLCCINLCLMYAQPANDKWTGAINLVPAVNEASCSPTLGTTIGTQDASQLSGLEKGPQHCSVNYFRDDVWYKFTTNSVLPDYGYLVKLMLDPKVLTDIKMAGIAVYESMSVTDEPIICTDQAFDNELRVCSSKLKPLQQYYIRIWSADGVENLWEVGEGTFGICVVSEQTYIVPQNVLWGSVTGEGDFNAGLNGWTTTTSCPGIELWKWSKDTMCIKGSFADGGGKINSPTNCNGAMCFDSDFFDNNGSSNQGTGLCPAPQTGMLISPNISLAGLEGEEGITLEFSQALRQYQSLFYIDYSYDNGANWESVEINTEFDDPVLYILNGPHVNNSVRVFIPDAQGKSTVKIRFRLEGNYYYWIVDDVFITKREPYNLKMSNYAAIAPNKLWQVDQLEGFGGLAEIVNLGAKAAINPKLKLEIFNSNNNLLWSDSTDYIDFATPMPGIYLPLKVPGKYHGKYTLTQDSVDFDNSDNEFEFDWTVTNNTMAKENIGVLGHGVTALADVNYTWGNIFHIVSNLNSEGKIMSCTEVQAGISNPQDLEGASFFMFLYKWTNSNGDNVVDEFERETIGFTQYDFEVSEVSNTLYTLPIYDFNTFEPGVILESNTTYILCVQYSSINPDIPFFILADNQLNYAATSSWQSINKGITTGNHVLDVGNTNTMSLQTLGNNEVPVIRMLIGSDSNKSYVSGKIFFDQECDGVFNNSDKGLAYKVIKDNNTNNPLTYSNKDGDFIIGLYELGNYSMSPKDIKGFTINPSSYAIVNDSLGKLYSNKDFSVCSDSNFHNLKVTITAGNPARPGFSNYYDICVENIGSNNEGAELSFDFNGGEGDNYTFIINADGGAVNGHTITWNIPDIDVFGKICKQITVTTKINTPLSTVFNPRAIVTLTGGNIDIDTLDNKDELSQIVVGSYDPNDKTPSKNGFTKGELQKGVSIEYQIRFQNTGTYLATFIDVYDTLQNTLDIRTFEMISASHPYTLTVIDDHILKWRFDNINLPDSTSDEPGSHGYIKFRIMTKENLTMSDIISNSAAIYFDYNPPVITNTAITQFVTPTFEILSEKKLDLIVFPNPSTDKTTLQFELPEKMDCKIEIRDLYGKLVFGKDYKARSKGLNEELLDLSEYSSGVYLLSVFSKDLSGEVKLVKR